MFTKHKRYGTCKLKIISCQKHKTLLPRITIYGGVSLSYDGTRLTRANDLAEAIHRYVELCSSIYPKVLDHIANSCDTYWRCAS